MSNILNASSSKQAGAAGTASRPVRLGRKGQEALSCVRMLAVSVLLGGLSACPTQAATLCTIVADASTGAKLMQEGQCDRRVTPASTFKIAISLMGFDNGFLKDEHTPALPFKLGYPDWLPAWRTTTDPTSWIKNSVVWYSQQVTQALGADRFAAYAHQFRYGNEDVSGDPGRNNGLTRAWLSSSLQVSPVEQIAFLRSVVSRTLPVSARAFDMTEHVTALTTLPGGWDVHGKTGMGFPKKKDGSNDEDHAFGWFVGWARHDRDAVIFARLIQDETPQEITAGVRARDTLLHDLPDVLPKR